MASKSGQQEPEKAEVIEELLDDLDSALDRVKVLYEQYFLGIQKQPPAYLHTDVERKLRDLAQIQIRNTALRYRFATLQQKYGSYNSYWRRTLRQIENGTYARNLSKVGRQAARTGAAVPEEILAAMPRRMREQVIRDREAALALARLRERQAQDDQLPTLADEDVEIDVDDLDAAAFIRESSDVRRNALIAAGAYRVDESDAGFDVDAFFASVSQDEAPPRDPSSQPPVVARTAEPGAASARSRRPSTKRPPIDEGPPSFAGAATRKITGPMRAVRPPSSPGIEPSPRSATGPMQTVRPPSHDDTEPRLSIPPVGAASPVAATRRITGPMRTVRPPSDPGPDPAGSPSSAAPDRAEQAGAPRPMPSGEPERRLSIPPIGAASPAAATRRITPPVRATRPPSNPDPEPSDLPSSAPPSSADAAWASGPAIRITGQSRAVAAPSSGGAGVVSGPSGEVPRPTSQSRAVAAPSIADARQPGRDAAGAADAASEPAVGDASAFAAESTQRARPAGIPAIPSVAPAGGAKAPLPSFNPQAPPPAERPDPARTAPSQATRPLRVAPGSAAAHAATPVETLTGPFPRIPSPPSSLPPRGAAVPLSPPPIPAPPSLGDRPPAPPERRPASEPVSAEAPSSASPPPSAPPAASSGDAAAAPVTDASRPAPPSQPSSHRTPPPVRAPSPPVLPKRADAPRPGAPERPSPEARQALPPGMTDAEVHALYVKYVKAKQILGEEAEPGTYGKLLRTINAQAPRIMEQYKAKGVDFSVVVKDSQVIIRAKPKP